MVAAGVFLLAILYLFVSSLQRPAVVSYGPTEDFARGTDTGLVRDTVTLDARDGSVWVYFDFERGATVDGRVDPDWDIALQRFHLITNGGPGYPGEGGALALPASFDEVSEAPAEGYAVTEGPISDAPANPALERWYAYSFFAHTLEPKPETYVVRTRDGRFVKIGVISYYCPEAVPGCFTFEYAYQSEGGRHLAP